MADRLRELMAINRAILSTLDDEEVLQRVVSSAVHLTAADTCLVLLAGPDGLGRAAASHGVDPDRLRDFAVSLDEDLASSLKAILELGPRDTFLAVPIMAQGSIEGVLVALRRAPRAAGADSGASAVDNAPGEASAPAGASAVDNAPGEASAPAGASAVDNAPGERDVHEETMLLSALADQAALALDHARRFREILRSDARKARLLMTIQQNATSGLIYLDRHLRVAEINQMAARLLGYAPDGTGETGGEADAVPREEPAEPTPADASDGNASDGNASGGNASGGNASGGNASGGNASGGNASDGNASGGKTPSKAAASLVGRRFLELVPPDDPARSLITEAWHSGRAAELREHTMTRVETDEGEGGDRGVPTPRYCDWRAQPIQDPQGNLEGLVLSITDVTREVRSREAAETEARQKDEFVAMLAHELRNPLSAISNATELLGRRARADPKLGRARDITRRQIRQMTRLLDDLLDVSRITRGKIRLQLEEVDLEDIVAQAVQSCQSLVERRNHTLERSVEGSTPGDRTLRADPDRLVQVISNLLTNAARYTDPGGSIRLWTRRRGDEVVIGVADNGVGIHPAMRDRIFELFVQSERGLDRRQGGLGLGLTLVKRLVHMHGGEVEVDSPGPGLGSEFRVRLPVWGPAERWTGRRTETDERWTGRRTETDELPAVRARPQQKAPADDEPEGAVGSGERGSLPETAGAVGSGEGGSAPETAGAEDEIPPQPARLTPEHASVPRTAAPRSRAVTEEPERSKGPGLRVLLVEDNADTAAMLSALLELNGHHPTRVSRGPIALQRIHEQPYEAVLLDIGLPGMDGIEVARRIRRLNLRPRPLLVAVSGYSRESHRARGGHDRGHDPTEMFDHYLVKPVEPGRLLEILEETGSG